MIEKKKRTRRRLLFLFAPLVYVFAGTMISVFADFIPYRDWVRLLISASGFLVLLWMMAIHRFLRKNILLLLLLFVLTTFVPTLVKHLATTTPAYTILQFGDSVLWIGVFVWAYYIGMHSDSAIRESNWVAWLILFFAGLFLGVKQFSAGRGIPLISTAYYALFLLPFALMVKKKAIRWILVLCAFATVLLSVKRTGFIAFVLSMTAYYVVDFKVNGTGSSKKIKMLLGGIAAAIIMYYFFMLYAERNNINIIERLHSIRDDGGSNRAYVWQITWGMICRSSIPAWMFGHGFNAVYLDSPLRLSAHSDFFEVIYDYGIIGTMLYLAFYGKLCGYFKRVCRQDPDLAPSFAVSLVLAVCMSLFAHLLIYPTHFLFLCVYWGLIIGRYDQGDRIRGRLHWKPL